ncbi:MAG: recombinase [Microgenomates group bacterium Gr01-1014_7]|nr:MAG: recombinase [Microgenomates group bacterium Gr01-1014_7]
MDSYMLEIDREGYMSTTPIEVTFDDSAATPFKAVKQDNKWQLQVNRNFLQLRGFTSTEIEGASALEGERIIKQVSLDSPEAVSAFRNWRSIGRQDSQIQTFQTLFERLSALNSLERRDPARAELAKGFLAKFASSRGNSLPEQLFADILSQEMNTNVQVEPIVQRATQGLSRQEEVEGRSVSPMDALESPNLSFEAKAVWFENRFLPWLEFLRNQEANRSQGDQQQPGQEQPQDQQEAKPPEEPPTPPTSSNEYEQHRGKEEKGESGPPIFKVGPYLGGYHEDDSFDLIDEATGRLIKSPTQSIKGQSVQLKIEPEQPDNPHRKISGYSGTNLFALPLTSHYQLTQQGLDDMKGMGIEVFADQEGHIFLKSDINQPYEVEIGKGDVSQRGITSRDTRTVETLSQDIDSEIERIKNLPGSSLEKARVWQTFVHDYFVYPQDEQVEGMYSNVDSQASNRLKTIVNSKLTDCYLAREFFVAGLKRLNLSDLEWRSVNGYYVAGKSKDGTAHLHSGNAHAWAKVRLIGSNDWIILDPTPEGDPVKQPGDEQLEGENQMEQFQDTSPELLSEDGLDQIEKEAQERQPQEKSLSAEEKWLMEFADQTGLPIEEARQIKDTLDEVDQMTDSEGRNILKRIKEQIDKIIQSYIREEDRMVGLVRMSQGQELEDPVAARLDIKTGILDPTGFNRMETVRKKEEFYGGFDVNLVVDGSSSMAEPAGGKIIYLVDTGKIKLLKFPQFWFDPTPQGKFMLTIAFGQSKYYVDSLSENTKRGLRQKALRGEFPSWAPVGYLNVIRDRRKTIIVDKKKAPVVVKALEMFATGNYRIMDIGSFLAKHGITTRRTKKGEGGKVIPSDQITYQILTNPFYYGHFRFKGELHEGKHSPIITKKLWDAVQKVVKRRSKVITKERVHKPYMGLFKCGECGYMITAEIKKGFTYYRCTKKSKTHKCTQLFTREEDVDKQLSDNLLTVSLRQDWADKMLDKLCLEEKEVAQSCQVFVQTKKDEIKIISDKLQRLLDSYLDEVIDKDSYLTKKSELLSLKKTLEEQIISFEQTQNVWLEPMKEWIMEAANVANIARGKDLDEKKVLALKIFGSNSTLKDRKVYCEALNQWSALRADPPTRDYAEGVGFGPTRSVSP